MKTLIVEDDFTSRLVLQKLLSQFGECHIAVNGKEAVEAFGAALEDGRGYDLVCMDLMLPEMDGREAVGRLRSLEQQRGVFSTSGAKIIMTTAVDDLKTIGRCYEELCDSYLVKPINLSVLIGELRRYGLIERGADHRYSIAAASDS